MRVELVAPIREIRNQSLEFSVEEDRASWGRKIVEEVDKLVIVEEGVCYFEPESEHLEVKKFLVAVTKSGRNLKVLEVNMPAERDQIVDDDPIDW